MDAYSYLCFLLLINFIMSLNLGKTIGELPVLNCSHGYYFSGVISGGWGINVVKSFLV